jgi:predicted MFS family arabinose efflux permease
VMFLAGTLSILFMVSDATLFVSIVTPEQYVDGQSLNYGSRALSFLGGPSVAGVLVQLVSAPVTVLFDALSFVGSALFLTRIRPAEPPPAAGGAGSVLAGARFIAGSPIVRSLLIACSLVNFFNLMWGALYAYYALRVLHFQPYMLGLLLAVAAAGGMLGTLVTKRVAARIGIGWAFLLGCLLFTAPAVMYPAAAGFSRPVALTVLFAAEFWIGFGVMMLDIAIGAISAAVIPDTLRSRVTGAFQAANYGVRPFGALAGGLLGTVLGLRSALWIAAIGGILGCLVMLPTALPRYRMPVAGVANAAEGDNIVGDILATGEK